MSEEIVVTHIDTGEQIWKGTAADARASKSMSKEIVRLVDKTATDGIERVSGKWNSKRL